MKINDIDLENWKSYDEILTDSLWIINKRDQQGIHTAEYHGNFIPQIPRQAMLRYTSKGETVLDTFLGLGTTLIECKRLGRNGLGIELIPEVVDRAEQLIGEESNPHDIKAKIFLGDSTQKSTFENIRRYLEDNLSQEKVQLIIMHPPYHDIIKFSNDSRDLSNAKDLQKFFRKFGKVVDNAYDLLAEKRFLVLVIGDKYTQGEWIPLGFRTMQEVQSKGFQLKSIVVKNMTGNRAKNNQENLWRYRALAGGFYIFKHEYVMFFQKK